MDVVVGRRIEALSFAAKLAEKVTNVHLGCKAAAQGKLGFHHTHVLPNFIEILGSMWEGLRIRPFLGNGGW